MQILIKLGSLDMFLIKNYMIAFFVHVELSKDQNYALLHSGKFNFGSATGNFAKKFIFFFWGGV